MRPISDYIAGGRPIGDVPRTTAAAGSGAVRRVVAQRKGPPAGWWGMAMLIVSEGTLLLAMVGTFFYLRFNTTTWPPPGDPEPKVIVPLILVACLSTTSILMHGAWRSVRAGRLAATRLLLVAALVIQTGYFAYEAHDYADELHRSPIGTDAYTSIHYVLLGADHAHVFVGILLTAWLIWKLSTGITTYRVNAVQAITWYWYFVTALTWVVVGTTVSAALR
ncbi:MAG TPA: cytochrome c oxidase subunit 3 [Gaiellaceae bacterium]